MGDALIGLGVLLMIIGPLLLIPVTWLLYRCVWWALIRSVPAERLTRGIASQAAVALPLVLVVSALVASYLPGHWEFERLCAQHAIPDASFRTRVDGFFRTQMFPYQSHKYLDQDSFSYIEAPDPYRKGLLLRYSKGANGNLEEDQVPVISSTFGFRETFSELPSGITTTEKVIDEIATERERARAARITYHGGPLSLVLGSYGISSCPDILSEEGSRHFTTFCDLESIVLRSEMDP